MLWQFCGCFTGFADSSELVKSLHDHQWLFKQHVTQISLIMSGYIQTMVTHFPEHEEWLFKRHDTQILLHNQVTSGCLPALSRFRYVIRPLCN